MNWLRRVQDVTSDREEREGERREGERSEGERGEG